MTRHDWFNYQKRQCWIVAYNTFMAKNAHIGENLEGLNELAAINADRALEHFRKRYTSVHA